MSAIKDYENNKWKVIGQKVGKPAKACEQYAKEHFPGMPNHSRAHDARLEALIALELFGNAKSR